MRTVLDSRSWEVDPNLHQIPWQKVGPFLGAGACKRLTVGVMWGDGVVKPAQAVMRALDEVVEKLGKLPGVEVIEWKPHRHDEGMDILVSPSSGKLSFIGQIEES